MPPTQPPLHTILPPLIFGAGTFNNQYNADDFSIPTNAIVARALALGVCAFDTSPYYGPSEELLGKALVDAKAPRESFQLVTKVGRIAASEFDYSAEWIRFSVAQSLQRLHTNYLDVVYCHDVEFVTPVEVLAAVRELRRLRDMKHIIRYVGISGYPVSLLCSLAELVLKETGEPLDAVMSYANFTLQNTTLLSAGLERLRRAGVACVPNASPLGMGLLRGVGVPVGGMGDFHPAPAELRRKVRAAASYLEGIDERLEVVSIRWALEHWAQEGGVDGKLGVSVIGVSTIAELEETMQVWESVLDSMDIPGREVESSERELSLKRKRAVDENANEISKILGEWKDFAWPSPHADFVNTRWANGALGQTS